MGLGHEHLTRLLTPRGWQLPMAIIFCDLGCAAFLVLDSWMHAPSRGPFGDPFSCLGPIWVLFGLHLAYFRPILVHGPGP